MRLYLDTNIILGWFKKMMQKERKGEEFKIPRVIKFVTSQKEFDLILSDLTKVEIIRYLISEWGCDPKFARKLGTILCNHLILPTLEVKLILMTF